MKSTLLFCICFFVFAFQSNASKLIIKELKYPKRIAVGDTLALKIDAENTGTGSVKYSFIGQTRTLPADLVCYDLNKSKTKYASIKKENGLPMLCSSSSYHTFFSAPFPQTGKKYFVWIKSDGGSICLRNKKKEIKWIWNKKNKLRWRLFGSFGKDTIGKKIYFMSGSKAPFARLESVIVTSNASFSPKGFKGDPTIFYWTPMASAVGNHKFTVTVEADGQKVERKIDVTVYDPSVKSTGDSNVKISASDQFPVTPVKSKVNLNQCPVMNILSDEYSSVISNKLFGLKLSDKFIQPLRCSEFKQLPGSITFPVKRRVYGMAFILSEYCQGELGQQTGCIIINYEDGTQISIPLREEYELAGTLRNRQVMAAIYLGTVSSSQAEFNLSLLPWRNPSPDKPVKSITFTNRHRVKVAGENKVIPMNVVSNSSQVLLGIAGLTSEKAVKSLLKMLPVSKATGKTVCDATVNFANIKGKINPMVFSTNETGVLDSDNAMFDRYLKIMNRIGCQILRFHSGWSLAKVYPNGLKEKRFDALERTISKLKKDHPERQIMICFNKIPKYIDPKTSKGRKLFAAICSDLVEELNLKKKFNIKYWEIYNEVYFKKIAEDRSLWEMYNETAAAMKKVDPTIKIGGYAPCWPSISNIRDFYKHCHKNTDFVSWHKYLTGSDKTTNEYIMSQTAAFGNDAKNITKVLKEITPDKKIELAITEYNINWNWKPHDPRQANYIGAAWLASVLNHLIRADVDIAQTWHSRGGGTFGLLSHDCSEIRPVAQLLYLCNNYVKGNYVYSKSSNSNIECLGYINNRSFGVLLINKGSKTVELSLSLLAAPKLKSPNFDGNTKEYSISESGYKIIINNFLGRSNLKIRLRPYEVKLLSSIETFRQ